MVRDRDVLEVPLCEEGNCYCRGLGKENLRSGTREGKVEGKKSRENERNQEP